jgi:CBS domain-containing protein
MRCCGADQYSTLTFREKRRTAADIQERIITLPVTSSVREAASVLVEAGTPILAVINPKDELVGVVTDWDITRASSQGMPGETSIEKIMTREVVTASPTDTILELVRKLEHYEISALPVVRDGPSSRSIQYTHPPLARFS